MIDRDHLAQQRAKLSSAKQALLEQWTRRNGSTPTTTIPRRSPDEPPPLSFAQERLWFLDRLAPGASAYNLPLMLRLAGQLDYAALQQSAHLLGQRHETLRTTFPTVDGLPVQVIAPTQQIAVPLVDLSAEPAAEQSAAVARLVAAEVDRPFDLAQGPLLRLTLFRLSEHEHRLLLVMHHIIGDGWSLRVYIGDLMDLYRACVKHAAGGNPEPMASPLPELPIQYADFAAWQRKRLQGEHLEQQLSYWKEQLAGATTILELPTDRPRPAVQTYAAAWHFLQLPASLMDGLKALSQQQGATMYMTLLAAFKTLLYRYTGQEDILVGTPVANRNWVETEGLIGCFVNTLVLRTQLTGSTTFRELLGRVRETALGTFAHMDTPFEKVVEAVQPERNMSHTPLFQVLFSLQNVPPPSKDSADLAVSLVRIERATTQFDLTIEISDAISRIGYNLSLFDGATIARLAAHFETLLAGIVANPDARLANLPLLTTAERQQILHDWNATRREYPQDRCVHQLIEEQAARTPDAVAVLFGDTQLTYAQLNRRANQLANHLRSLGVGAQAQGDTLVGVCLDRSIDLVVSLLAVLKAGAAYVPLDPTYPQERLAYMLDDAGVAAVITQQQHATTLPQVAPVVCLDADWTTIALQPETPTGSQVAPTALAYAIYTSGSTGRPKGVLIPHRALTNFLCAMQEQPGFSAANTLIAVTTVAFDITGLELYLPLIAGGSLLLLSREAAADGAQLREALGRFPAPVMQATPATWRLLLESGWTGNPALRAFCGGEALPRDLANLVSGRVAELWNLYGPTETTIWSTAGQITQGERPVALGQPIANTQLYILDRSGQPAPIGVWGELHIGGDGLARGYRNRPDLTAEKFVPDPFSATPGSRLYRTGDLVRYRGDGTIEFQGRIDYQVKIRGFRIELGEIEHVLSAHPSIREAAVIVHTDEAGDQRLVAYVVGEQKNKETNEQMETLAPPSPVATGEGGWGDEGLLTNRGEGLASALREFLAERLPAYMIPAAFVALDALPRTPNGKLDRKALAADTTPVLDQSQAYVAPTTPEEEMLAEIWAGILRREQIGIHDNFFALGGHSLLATQLIARVQSAFQVELNLSTIFEAPTIAEMAYTIEDRLLEKLAALSDDEVQQLMAAALTPAARPNL
ncbi:MAG TPA: amino acid adenylation domain-containing protein [Herpetosiphonaceae bacterium]